VKPSGFEFIELKLSSFRQYILQESVLQLLIRSVNDMYQHIPVIIPCEP